MGIKVRAPSNSIMLNFRTCCLASGSLWWLHIGKDSLPGVERHLWPLLRVSPSGTVYPQLSHRTSVFAKSLLRVGGICH